MNVNLQSFMAACVQFNPKLYHQDENIEILAAKIEEAAKNGAKLIVTPEMVTTGYYHKNRKQIQPYIDTIPGFTTQIFSRIAEQYGAYIVIGMPEIDPETGIYYNSAALVGPGNYIQKYRKVHQWESEAHWAAWGDLGVEVFETELGKIAINICMDSVYFESARLAAVNGADLLVFLTNSSTQTISVLQARAETNGLYVISSNRSNTECEFHMVGASAIWSPFGEKIAETKYICSPSEDEDDPVILYGEIQTKNYKNEAKNRLMERRPELYKDLMLYIAPWDYTKDNGSREISAATVQYEPIIGNKDANLKKIQELIARSVRIANKNLCKLDVIVLPELCLTGPVDQMELSEIHALADELESFYMQSLYKLANQFDVHLIFGCIEQREQQFYNSAFLVAPNQSIEGIYRKTHLTPSDKRWATAGTEISVFPSEKLGSVGIAIGYDAAFPEVGGLMAVYRADLVVIPSMWNGSFGKPVDIYDTIYKDKSPKGSVTHWDAMAVSSQAYTIVANFIGTTFQFLGRSAFYTTDPFYSGELPIIATEDQEEAVFFTCKTCPDTWFNQEKLIASRRTYFYKALVC